MPLNVIHPPLSGGPLQALQSALRSPVAGQPARPGLLVAGATGALGNEVVRRLAGSGRFSRTQVLVREPMITGLAQVGILLAGGDDIDTWPPCPLAPETGLVMFEPPRLYHDRERALWTPQPAQLGALARWLLRSGVKTLVLVLPHAQGTLPQALRHGLASIDEQEIAALGFERVLLVRSAQKQAARVFSNPLDRLAAWMLSVLRFMIPSSAMPVRPVKIAAFVDAALRLLPPGTHVASPELLWQAGQAPDLDGVVRAWLDNGRHPERV